MNKFFILLSLLFFLGTGYSQNLVKNHSFELYKKCPKTLTQKKLKLKKGVINVKGLPNYFNSCSDNLSGAKNPYGYQIPQDGDGFVGIISTSDYRNAGECQVREYVQMKLSKPLIAGYKYDVKFFASLANNSGYTTDQLGVVFTNDDRYKHGINKFIGKPDINNPYHEFLSDTVNWMPITGIYSAKGGEEYIIIGNFQKCNLASRKAINPNDSASLMDRTKQKYLQDLNSSYDHLNNGFGKLYVEKLAYYFIDNVSVTPRVQNDSVTQLLPDLACKETPIIPENAQELIEDGSFELSKNRKNPYWTTASKGTPDLVPGVSGIYLYSGAHKNNREYIISKLIHQVSPCEKYYFSMKILRSESHQFAVDKIGIALTDSLYFQKNRDVIPIQPVFETQKFKVIESANQWVRICGEFTPDTCANYIIIGNFSTDEQTYVFPVHTNPNESPYAHYMIDDVSLVKIDSTPDCLLACKPEPIILIHEDSIPVQPEPFVTDTFYVQFETSSSNSNPVPQKSIEYLKEQLAKNSELKIYIIGHTDNTGTDQINNTLSIKRAQSVANELLNSGIDTNRIVIEAFGSTRPNTSNKTKDGRKKNRRVEVYLSE